LKPFLPNLAVTFANDGEQPVPGEPIREEEPNLHGRTRTTCRLCGECDFGCNYGSKNTLDYTYLSAAKRHGADLRTNCEVVTIEPRREGGYAVHYLEYPTAVDPSQALPASRTMTAGRLVLAAGTIGSTLLLLRNRSAFPRLSHRLGTRFSGNGDLLAFAVRTTEVVDGHQVPRVIDPSYGPVITSAARVGDQLDGEVGRGFYLEDAGFPSHVAWVLHLLGAARGIRGLLFSRRLFQGWLTDNPETEHGADLARLLGSTDLSAGVLPLLAMGATSRMGPCGCTEASWPSTGASAARTPTSPASVLCHSGWHRSSARATSTARCGTSVGPSRSTRSVAARWAGTREGVVDPFGEVFGYPGLYVADGAVMPGPVGVNPSLTIAALADRFADRLLERKGATNP
jgi:cholesterol oxidase